MFAVFKPGNQEPLRSVIINQSQLGGRQAIPQTFESVTQATVIQF